MNFTECCQLYLQGESASNISKMIGLSTRSVQRRLKKAGVIRDRFDSFRLAIKMGRMKYDHLKVDEKTRKRRKTINLTQRFAIFSRDNFKCVYCGNGKKDGARLEVDHIIQLVDGGNNDDTNLQTICSDCNLGKYLYSKGKND